MSQLRRVASLTALILLLGVPVAQACDAWASTMPECPMSNPAPDHCAPKVSIADCCDMQALPDETSGTLIQAPGISRLALLPTDWIRTIGADRSLELAAAPGVDSVSYGGCPSYRLFATLLL